MYLLGSSKLATKGLRGADHFFAVWCGRTCTAQPIAAPGTDSDKNDLFFCVFTVVEILIEVVAEILLSSALHPKQGQEKTPFDKPVKEGG